MLKSEIDKKIAIDEFDGEKLICKFRLVIAVIFIFSVPAISLMRSLSGELPFPFRAYICCSLFFIYAVFIYFYLKKRETVPPAYKYICVITDILIHSASIWVGCTYPLIAPAITYLSTWALFFLILIIIGAFRYSVPCAYFSGIFAGFCYFLVVVINGKNLDLPYFFIFENDTINVSFPVINESFRVIAMIVTGFITGVACKRHFKLFNDMLDSQSKAAEATERIVEQTRHIAQIIQKSTDDIFLSSREIFSTANSQAANIQQIETTITQNKNIAGEIAEKTSSVAEISMKMEEDVIHGFSVLQRNVEQLGDIKYKNDGLISGIISLGNKILKIRDIVKKINSITDQTKVIAFNASLEAASAGERGKRFAVVASEVNRLADDIASLTMQIHEQAEEIQSSSASLIVSSEESADKITEGNNLIKELEEIFSEIRSGAETTSYQAQNITISTQKQLKSTEHTNIAIADISKGLTNFIQSTRVATSSAEDLTQMTQELGHLLSGKAER